MPESNRSRRSRRAFAETVIAVAVLATALAGCMNRRTVVPMDPDSSPAPPPAASDLLARFAYGRQPPVVSNHDLPAEGAYDVKRLSFRSAGDSGQPDDLARGTYYVGRGGPPKPIVVIVPIWGRPDVYPVRKLSRAVRRRSEGATHVLVLEGPNRLIDFPAMARASDAATFRDVAATMAERCRVSVVDIRRWVDWLERRPEVDPDRIAIVGFSAGAVSAANAFLLDERIDAAVVAMGGTGFAAIMANDPCRAAVARKHAIERFDWSVDRYRDEMDAIFGFLDADRLAGRFEPERVLVIEAGRDERIPPDSRERLWNALGRPERIRLDYRHRNAFMSMTPLGGNFTTDRIYAFLQTAFATDTEP